MGLARFVFGQRKAGFNKGAVTERLAFDEPDFEPLEWLMSASGAIAVNGKQEVALIKPLGDGLVTRRLGLRELHIRCEGSNLIIERPDHTFSGMVIGAPSEAEAHQWLVRLTDAS